MDEAEQSMLGGSMRRSSLSPYALYYQRLRQRRGGSVAKVAIARKLAVRMYWMLRRPVNYAQLVRTQGSSRGTLVQS